MSPTFATALAIVLAVEGGYVNGPHDPGGPTNYGITQGVYDNWRSYHGQPSQPVSRITKDEAEAIYYELFWQGEPERWDEAGHPGIALYVFDMRVQHGGWERIYNEAKDTLELHPLLGLALLHAERTDYYTRLKHWPDFGRGWMRRAATVYRKAMELEHPDGLLRVDLLDINGTRWDVGIARMVGRKIYARGSKRSWLQEWWRRLQRVPEREA